MRISVIKGDPGYLADAWAYRVELDGVVQEPPSGLAICTADEEGGIVEHYVRDGRNGFHRDSATGKLAMATRSGIVRILPPQWAANGHAC